MNAMPERLGIALSGGGFRASFFHLGVLRRLAELDLLRYVATISTVSGGSILGAHYYLLFMKKFEDHQGRLTREHFIQIVDELEAQFIAGNRADLRNRLFRSVLAHLRALLLGRSYSRPMARIYAKYLYGPATWALFHDESLVTRGVPLHQAIVLTSKAEGESRTAATSRLNSSGYPDHLEAGTALRELNTGDPRIVPQIPKLVMNSTCLNTGGPFLFMMNEIGAPAVGWVRNDEVFMLMQYKTLLAHMSRAEFDNDNFEKALDEAYKEGARLEGLHTLADLPHTAFRKVAVKTADGQERRVIPFPPHTAEHLRFYLAATEKIDSGDTSSGSGKWYRFTTTSQSVQSLARAAAWPAVRQLFECDFGKLRHAKVAAWYLLDRRNWSNDKGERRGGYTRAEHAARFREAIGAISRDLTEHLGLGTYIRRDALFLLLDLYYLRSAENLDWDAPQQLASITVPHAVAASANFPPVFTPFRLFRLFTVEKYDPIALTDGGINDNQGIEAVLEDGCTWLIASDAGGLTQRQANPPDARLPMMDRIINVLMGGLRDLQLRPVLAEPQTTSGESMRRRDERQRVHFHILDPLTREDHDAVPPDLIARIRTDLDSFNDVEIRLLIRRGYLLADEKVRSLMRRNSPFGGLATPPRKRAPAAPKRTPHVERVLRGSPLRLGRLSEAYPVAAAILAALTALLAMMNPLDNYDVIRRFFGADVGGIAVLRDFIARSPLLHSVASQWLVGIDSLKQLSLTWIVLTIWIGYLAGRGLMSVLTARRRRLSSGSRSDRLITRLATLAGTAPRFASIVTAIFLTLFLVSGRAIFLVGVVPLWSIPIAAAFWVVSAVFTPLWIAVGSLDRRWPYRLWNGTR